jgi:hypothetical protein
MESFALTLRLTVFSPEPLQCRQAKAQRSRHLLGAIPVGEHGFDRRQWVFLVSVVASRWVGLQIIVD